MSLGIGVDIVDPKPWTGKDALQDIGNISQSIAVGQVLIHIGQFVFHESATNTQKHNRDLFLVNLVNHVLQIFLGGGRVHLLKGIIATQFDDYQRGLETQDLILDSGYRTSGSDSRFTQIHDFRTQTLGQECHEAFLFFNEVSGGQAVSQNDHRTFFFAFGEFDLGTRASTNKQGQQEAEENPRAMNWIAMTGTNGFIGHNLVLEILDKKEHTLELEIGFVLGADLKTSLKRSTHARFIDNPKYEFCLASEFSQRVRELTEKFQSPPMAIIHNGACSATTETDPNVFRTLNVESSQELFKLASELAIPFLYASSASVYGDGSLGFSDELNENEKYSPLNLYGQSKHQFDKWALAQDTAPPNWFGMRYFNVYGPHEEHKKSQASILHWGSRQVAENGFIRLYKSHNSEIQDGEQQRDFVSVFDIVRITFELLKLSLSQKSAKIPGCFVNMGRGQATSWLEMGEALFKAMGRETQFQFVDMPAALRQHYQNYTKADLSTLERLGISSQFLTHEEAFKKSLPELLSIL